MPRYMVTHSLLSSWLYAMRDNPYADATTERDPFEDFLRALRREPSETTEAMRNGIEFEDLVTDIINGCGDRSHKWWDAAYQIAQELKGAQLQFKASRDLIVDGIEVLLYGRLDALKAGMISDIKFSKGYERGKYIDSTQHPAYLYIVPEAYAFQYIVSNGNEVWHELYWRDEAPDIRVVIHDFFQWLYANGLMGEYMAHWQAA